jgi:hypothetical protein
MCTLLADWAEGYQGHNSKVSCWDRRTDAPRVHGDIRRLIAGPQEQRQQWQHHFLTEIFAESEQANHYSDWHNAKDRHQILDPLENFPQLLDLRRELVHKGAWQNICPKAVFIFSKGDLQLDLFRIMAVLAEEIELVSENRRSALNTVNDLQSKGVSFRLRCEIEIVQRNSKEVVLRTKAGEQDNQSESNMPHTDIESEPQTQDFDELVLCCRADEAKNRLDRHATMKEKFVLGEVKFYNDITVTHSYSEYIQSIFESRFKKDLCTLATTKNRKDQISFATSEPRCQKDRWVSFQQMYYVHSFPSESDKIEMGFDCTNFQHQFREHTGEGSAPPEHDRHVFQTISLNDQQTISGQLTTSKKTESSPENGGIKLPSLASSSPRYDVY